MLEGLKKLVEFYRFEKRVKQTNDCIPTYEKFEKYMVKDWLLIGSARVKCSRSKIKKLLPLKSLRITHVWMDGEISIEFDKSEFHSVLTNKNKIIVSFLESYLDNDWKSRFKIYFENKDTLILLLDAINSRSEIDVEQEITAIMNYLLDEIKSERQSNLKINVDNLKQRMEIELEFIKRRKEAQNLDFK